MPRKSIDNGCTPCTLDARVLPKGIISSNSFAFSGSRGTGHRCQLNRGINSLVRCYTVEAEIQAHQSGYVIGHHSPYKTGKLPGDSCSGYILIFSLRNIFVHLPHTRIGFIRICNDF